MAVVQEELSTEVGRSGMTCMRRTSIPLGRFCKSLIMIRLTMNVGVLVRLRLTWSIYACNRIGIDGLDNSILSDLVLRYSPEYYVFLANSSNVIFNNFDISGFSKSNNTAKNTDGWDTYRSTDITIMNSVINNGDGESTLTPLSP